MIGSVKQCLRKILGNARLSYDELVTVLVEVEATINCRSLAYEYNEVDEEVLTPSLLIYGRRINNMPDEIVEPDDVRNEVSCSARFKYLSSRLEHFWERWKREYLTYLREFHRAMRTRQNKEVIQIGDVVTAFEEGTRRNKWKLVVEENLVEGKDDIVRGAKVRVIKGKVKRLSRPLQKLFPIEVRDDGEVRQ